MVGCGVGSDANAHDVQTRCQNCNSQGALRERGERATQQGEFLCTPTRARESKSSIRACVRERASHAAESERERERVSKCCSVAQGREEGGVHSGRHKD